MTPLPFRASTHQSDNKIHLLLAATGSVATIKLPQILTALSVHQNLSIRLILTTSASNFLASQSAEQPSLAWLHSIPNVDGIHLDADEWNPAWTRDAPILHIELRRWADMMLIVPLSANSLAKIVHGIADNLVTSVVRAWDVSGRIDAMRPGMEGTRTEGKGCKRIWVAPAMNTAMWEHPVTDNQLAVLEGEWGEERGGWFTVLPTAEKMLACGDLGAGAMMEWDDIVRRVEERLELKHDLPPKQRVG